MVFCHRSDSPPFGLSFNPLESDVLDKADGQDGSLSHI